VRSVWIYVFTFSKLVYALQFYYLRNILRFANYLAFTRRIRETNHAAKDSTKHEYVTGFTDANLRSPYISESIVAARCARVINRLSYYRIALRVSV